MSILTKVVLKTLKEVKIGWLASSFDATKIPIVVDDEGNVHDGKRRVRMALQQGLESLPALVLPAPQAAAVAAIIGLIQEARR